MRCSATLIHILSAGRCNAIAFPAGIADATIAKLIAALHATTVSAQLPRAGRTAVCLALSAVHPMPASRAQAAKRAKLINAQSSILAAQIGAREQGALIHISLAFAALQNILDNVNFGM